ncbi:MAG: hypothetical protein NW218_00195 [Saprospiraceae bacterium]|nr:hypothetical protein [Saprospiraceae bacterium]
MKKYLFLFALSCTVLHVLPGQKPFIPSDSILVDGLVEAPLVINSAYLHTFAPESLDSLLITNYLGIKKSVLHQLKVVPLKKVLERVAIVSDNPKQLSQYYLLCSATDGYFVLFSWNELYNNGLGNEIYLLVESDGKPVEQLENRMVLFSNSDTYTGRRYIKGLSKITIGKAGK